MMEIPAKIIKSATDKKYINYKDLYYYDEKQLFKEINDKQIKNLFMNFKIS